MLVSDLCSPAAVISSDELELCLFSASFASSCSMSLLCNQICQALSCWRICCIALNYVCIIRLSQSLCLETAYQHAKNNCLSYKLGGMLRSHCCCKSAKLCRLICSQCVFQYESRCTLLCKLVLPILLCLRPLLCLMPLPLLSLLSTLCLSWTQLPLPLLSLLPLRLLSLPLLSQLTLGTSLEDVS